MQNKFDEKSCHGNEKKTLKIFDLPLFTLRKI